MEKIKPIFNISNDSLKEYSKELYNKILNSPYFSKLKEEGWTNQEIADNTSKFSDYIDDLEKASKIKTYEDCLKYGMSQRLILVREGKIISRNYEVLEPYKKHLAFIEHYEVRDFPTDLLNAKFTEVKPKVRKEINEAIKSKKWVYLTGALRSGRSYTAIAMANSFANKNVGRIAFLNCVTRFKELSDFFFKSKSDFNELMAMYQNIDLLILDDFGSEYKNEITRDNILIPPLKERASRKLLTVFTSDFSLNDVLTLYTLNSKTGEILINNLKKILDQMIDKEIEVSNLTLY